MKKNNKGFSLVELIIVIAIMAILAGALAPALIKYINKSRRSADISNADTIRSACQTALSNPAAFDACANAESNGVATFTSTALGQGGTDFTDETKSILGGTDLTQKYGAHKGDAFSVTIKTADNEVTVYDAANGTEITPNAQGAYAD